MIHAHTAYGLALHLPFPCPVLPHAPDNIGPDVTLVEGPVPHNLAAPVAQEDNWQVERGRFLWKAGRRAGRFLVEGGHRITLQRGRVAEDEVISSHFLDNVLAAALRQIGLLILHANSVVTPRGAIAVSGQSGAGKSTTMAALLRKGCPMLADDITALRFSRIGAIEVVPGIPQFSLCEDAAGNLRPDVKDLTRHRTQSRKFVVPAWSAMAKAAAPLQAIYLLRTHSGHDLRIQSVEGAEKFAALQECIYGPLLPEEHPGLFPLFTTLTRQVAVFRIERPAGRWTVEAVAEVLLHG